MRGATRTALFRDWTVFCNSAQVEAGELVVADRHDMDFPVGMHHIRREYGNAGSNF